jgi:hypothetical protein
VEPSDLRHHFQHLTRYTLATVLNAVTSLHLTVAYQPSFPGLKYQWSIQTALRESVPILGEP